ncbi:MAG: retropepsin-like aspartic protease, partial [Gemmatimonadota bacterium]
MKRALSPLLVLAAGLLLTACPPDDTREGPSDPAVTAGLVQLYARGDFFELRDRLDTLAGLGGPEPAFLRAVVANAFNDPEGSDRALAPLGEAATLPDSLRAEVYRLRFRNHMRLGEYRAALDAAGLLADLPAADSAIRNDVENEARAAAALIDVPPQRIVSRASSEIRRRPDSRIPVQVGDSAGRGYVLDTGANLSTLMRSEAESLGLRIREAGVEVGTSTGTTVTADVTVAPRVRLGEVVLENVVFLVVPDQVLTFGESFRIEGIIGFPVIDALGEVQFHAGGVLRIPGDVPRRTPQNLALDYLTPLIEVGVLGHPAICDLDTGANRTSLHEPFYRRYRAS